MLITGSIYIIYPMDPWTFWVEDVSVGSSGEQRVLHYYCYSVLVDAVNVAFGFDAEVV